MKKIVIIGAGPAGLTAAYEVLKNDKNNYEVIILEEDKQVGGISKTINYKGNRMDLGGHRFFTKEKQVNDLWLELLPLQGKPSYDDKKLKIKKPISKKGPDPEKDNKVMLLRNRVSRIYYNNKFFDYPISLNFKTIKKMGFVTTMSCGFSYLKTRIFKRKEESLADFYINGFGKKLYSMFFQGYTKKVWGRDPSEISKDWGKQRVKGLSIKAVIKDYFFKVFKINNKNKETSLIEQYLYPKYGPGELYEEMAKEIKKMGGKIELNTKVISIHKTKNKIDRITYIKDNKKEYLRPDILVSSMPIKDLVMNMNSVNKKVLEVASNLPYRDFITIGVLVDKLNLKNETNIKTLNNNIPDCWLYIQDDGYKLGRIQVFNNWSPYMVKDINNTVWISLEYFCNEGDSFWNFSDKQITDFALRELKDMKVIDDKVLDTHVERVKKAYPAYFDSYSDFPVIRRYLDKIDNLYCIGRNGQHRYNNMDHSMMTGIKLAELLVNNKGSKEDIWNVNTEETYHEKEEKKKSN